MKKERTYPTHSKKSVIILSCSLLESIVLDSEPDFAGTNPDAEEIPVLLSTTNVSSLCLYAEINSLIVTTYNMTTSHIFFLALFPFPFELPVILLL